MMNYIIFDLEATCWEHDRHRINEIIEIGAVKLNDRLETIGDFSKFIKPMNSPVLSDFCTRLTSITQKDVDEAPTFYTIMAEFEKWIVSADSQVILCSWGFYDKNQIINECKRKNYWGEIQNLLDRHINIKDQFAAIKNVKTCGMAKALSLLEIPLEGTHHRGIDDAKNIAQIFKVIFHELSF